MSSATATLPALKHVLFATDFSEYSAKALRHALAFTRGVGGSFYLAHVVSSVSFALAGPAAVGLADDAAWRDLQQLESKLDDVGALAGIPHHTFLCEGDICSQIEEIVERENIDLAVVGTHGRGGLRKLLAGSVAEDIFRRISCPVLVIGPHVTDSPETGEAIAPNRILLATDFGDASRHAVAYAASLTSQNHGKVVLLHVIPPLALTSADSYWYLGSQLDGMRKATEVQTLELLKKLVPPELGLGDRVEFATEIDFPEEGILRAATKHKADLILLGLRGRASGTTSHNPWEIADRVICGASVPVLTVKA